MGTPDLGAPAAPMSAATSPPPHWSGQAGALAAGAGSAFIGLVVLLQWLRDDLWWIDAQLSAYLH